MCECCAPIEKNLAIFFTLTRFAFIILSIVGIALVPHNGKNKDQNFGIFLCSILYGIINFFSLWSTFCCVKEEEKECCSATDEGCCCCDCPCFTDELCFCCLAEEDINNDFSGIIAILFLVFFYLRCYAWILIKCCGKRSRYCIQIFSILCDLEYFVLIIVYSTNMPAFFIILEILLFLSGLSTIIIMIYINYNYKKESEEIEPPQNPLSTEIIDIEENEMGNGNEIDNENVYNVTPAYQ